MYVLAKSCKTLILWYLDLCTQSLCFHLQTIINCKQLKWFTPIYIVRKAPILASQLLICQCHVYAFYSQKENQKSKTKQYLFPPRFWTKLTVFVHGNTFLFFKSSAWKSKLLIVLWYKISECSVCMWFTLQTITMLV